MPEGDSTARAAARLGPVLTGRQLTQVDGVPALRRRAGTLIGRRVQGVRTHGKHLLIDVDGDLTIHVWLGMSGRWVVRSADGRVESEGEAFGTPAEDGAVRLRLKTEKGVALCYSAPTVEIERRRVIDQALRRLGPDVLADQFDLEEYVKRARLLPSSTIVADLLLDQRVLAGVGNEYKSEILFLEGLHPERIIGDLDRAALEALAGRARKLMIPNARRRGPRATTGIRGIRTWVYDRANKGCRRCHTPIESARIGERNARVTYWCPTCQPDG